MVKIEGGLSSPPSLYLRLLRHPSLGLGIPRFTRNKLRNPQVKNVVAQFIGQLCLMNQATTKCGGEATCTDVPLCHCEEVRQATGDEAIPHPTEIAALRSQ